MTLNQEQALVVNELENNILLLASAGTGKTNTLSSRISNIIKSNKAKAMKGSYSNVFSLFPYNFFNSLSHFCTSLISKGYT